MPVPCRQSYLVLYPLQPSWKKLWGMGDWHTGKDPAHISLEAADPQDSSEEPVVALCSCGRGYQGGQCLRVHTPKGHDEAHMASTNYGLPCVEQPQWIKTNKTSTGRGF